MGEASGRAAEEPPSDTELLARTRGGDAGAYEELRRRHGEAILRYARHCCRDETTARALTDEVFARVLAAVRAGSGPDTAVRVHLLATVRRVAAVWGGSAGWERLADGFAVFAVAAGSSESGESFESDADVRAMRKAERSTVVRAFRGLPERWQVVLWHTVVEGESPREVAPRLGLTPGATAMLAYRAREGLRQAYLQAHISRSRAVTGDCARHVDRLGTYARGALRARMDRGLRRHVERCADCRSAALGTWEVCERLRALLPVAVVGWGARTYPAGEAGAPGVEGAAADTPVAAGASGTVSLPLSFPLVGGAMDTPEPAVPGTAGAAGSGAAVFEGLGATAKAGVTAGVMAAAVATALTLALVADGQRPDGPRPGSPPSVASVPGVPGSGAADARAGGSEPLGVLSSESAGSSGGGTPVLPPGAESAPGPRAGSSSRPETGPGSSGPGPESGPGAESSLPGPAPTGRVPAPTASPSPSTPSASTVHRLDRLARNSSAAPSLRGGESGWMWPRSGLRIGGRDRGHGVTVRARSTLTVGLGRSCTAFDALVGVDDLTAVPAAVRFSVYGDGVLLWRSDVVRRGDAPVPVHVSLSGRETLRLVVEPRTALDAAALAGWAQARITCG